LNLPTTALLVPTKTAMEPMTMGFSKSIRVTGALDLELLPMVVVIRVLTCFNVKPMLSALWKSIISKVSLLGLLTTTTGSTARVLQSTAKALGGYST